MHEQYNCSNSIDVPHFPDSERKAGIRQRYRPFASVGEEAENIPNVSCEGHGWSSVTLPNLASKQASTHTHTQLKGYFDIS